MRRLNALVIATSMLLALSSAVCQAQDVKVYPGAKHDEKVSRDATAAAPGKQVDVYLTSDSFDNVQAFYKGLYKELPMHMHGAVPGQQQAMRMTFFVVDGAATLASSKYWVKVQHPYLDEAHKAQDLTVIETIRSK
jgi:hypothetical protein